MGFDNDPFEELLLRIPLDEFGNGDIGWECMSCGGSSLNWTKEDSIDLVIENWKEHLKYSHGLEHLPKVSKDEAIKLVESNWETSPELRELLRNIKSKEKH